MTATTADAGLLKAQFDRLADRYNDLFHCYVMIEPDALADMREWHSHFHSHRELPAEVAALALGDCPLGGCKIVDYAAAGGSPSYSIYLSPDVTNDADKALVEFRALAAKCASLPLRNPERWWHGADMEAGMMFSPDADGNPIPGTTSGSTGNPSLRVLRWLDHLYAINQQSERFNPRFAWTVLPASVFRASSWAIDAIGPALEPRLFSLDEVARVVGWKEQTLRNNFPVKEFRYPEPAQPGRPALYRFTDWRPLLLTKLSENVIPMTDEEALIKLNTLAKVSSPG